MKSYKEIPRSSDNISKLAKIVFNRWTMQEVRDYCLENLTWSYEQDPDLFQETWLRTFRQDNADI